MNHTHDYVAEMFVLQMRTGIITPITQPTAKRRQLETPTRCTFICCVGSLPEDESYVSLVQHGVQTHSAAGPLAADAAAPGGAAGAALNASLPAGAEPAAEADAEPPAEAEAEPPLLMTSPE